MYIERCTHGSERGWRKPVAEMRQDGASPLYHNRGDRDDFGDLHTLEIGDTITWTTKLGTRTYEVVSVEKVLETDDSGTAATTENMITLYTCVMNQREYRWQVQAVEV